VPATDNRKIDAVLFDVGGFLGIGEKPVAIAFRDLGIAMDQDKRLILRTAFTRDRLDAAPQHDNDTYTCRIATRFSSSRATARRHGSDNPGRGVAPDGSRAPAATIRRI
jgi:hypothetical protein